MNFLKSFSFGLALCGLLLAPFEASGQSTGKRSVLRFSLGDALARTGLKAAGKLDCPKGENCYCTRPAKVTDYKAACKYVDKAKQFVQVKQYDSASDCTIACLGILLENAKEGSQIKGTEEKPSEEKVSPSATCEKLPFANGVMANCCGSKGVMNGKRICLSEK